MSQISDELNNTPSEFPNSGDPHWCASNKSTIAANIVSKRLQSNIMKNVNHPSHYQTKSGIEVIDVIEAFDLGFNLGNVIKYVLRCGKKDSDIQELEKAKWYLEREISNRKAKNEKQN